MHEEHFPYVERLLKQPWFERRVESGSLPGSRWLAGGPEGHILSTRFRWLEHTALWFPCHAHEISALQLHDAARLTLDLARDAADNGWILKDASVWNVLHSAGRPMFCDILSFIPSAPAAVWPAYAQFQRNFVIPLLLHKRLGLRPSEIYVLHRNAIGPEEARRMVKGWGAWRQPALEAITLPAYFMRHLRSVKRAIEALDRARSSPPFLRAMLSGTYGRLQRHLDRVRPVPDTSSWARGTSRRVHDSEDDRQAKLIFARRALSNPAIRTVLDLACNTGEFSVLAAELGKQVAAADYDERCLQRLYARVRENRVAIQPVVLDVARPTPPVGWMNREIAGTLTRAAGRFDCILALALLPRLLITERVALEQICDLLVSLQSSTLLVEWVEPHDAEFRALAGLDIGLYDGVTRQRFEQMISARFDIHGSELLPGGSRILYDCRRRSA